jgi:hypothetical protein
MGKAKIYGELAEGYTIPVLNNREIRAAAGIMFLTAFISLFVIINSANFVPIKYVLSLFLVEFFIRLFIHPRYAPLLITGRLIVSNQYPEYTGAAQKKFAWYIGFAISLTMFILMVVMNTYSPVTGIACLICLILMFFESAFGICVGCKIYRMIEKEKAQYCAGEVCDIKQKHAIQRVSGYQQLMLLLMVVFIVLLSTFFGRDFKEKPRPLFSQADREMAQCRLQPRSGAVNPAGIDDYKEPTPLFETLPMYGILSGS